MGRTFYDARTCENRETALFILKRRVASMIFLRVQVCEGWIQISMVNLNRKQWIDV